MIMFIAFNMNCISSFFQQLLDHLNESAVYNDVDVTTFQKRLDELREIVRKDVESGRHPAAMTKLLERQLHECGSSCLVQAACLWRAVRHVY